MDDLDDARQLETLRISQALEKLNSDEREAVREIDRDLAARGSLNSGLRIQSHFKARADKLARLVDIRIEIRKDLIRWVPELGTSAELDALLADIERMLGHASGDARSGAFLLPAAAATGPGVSNELRRMTLAEVQGLQVSARTRIEILKKEIGLKINDRDNPRTPTNVVNNYGSMGNVQQVIGDIHQGPPELAKLLGEFANAINNAQELGNERRREFMEQVAFVAKQISAPVEERQSGVVKAVVTGWKALSTVPEIVKAMTPLLPMLAKLFGFEWPA